MLDNIEKLHGKESEIQKRLNIYNRPSTMDRSVIVEINLDNECDLAYLRAAWKRHMLRHETNLDDVLDI